MQVLGLRFDAPLMSFGGPRIDNRGVTDAFPGQALVTGLLGNALGYVRTDFAALQALQARLLYAVRQDRVGERLQDYQTVGLDQGFLAEGWTTAGTPEGREGGSAKESTHIRYRDYHADAVFTVALTLRPGGAAEPTLADLGAALLRPVSPLFLGRKGCVPAGRVLLTLEPIEVESLHHALEVLPWPAHHDVGGGPWRAWWPPGQGPDGHQEIPVADTKDWANQIHVGRRWVWEGWVTPQEVPDGP